MTAFSQSIYSKQLRWMSQEKLKETGLVMFGFSCFTVSRWCLAKTWERKYLRVAKAKPCIHVCVCAKSLQSRLTLCDPVDCSLPGSSVHGILQAILEWVAMPSSKRSSWPRDRTHISRIAGGFYTAEPLWKPPNHWTTREFATLWRFYAVSSL